MHIEADLSLHFLRGMLDCFITRVTSIVHSPAWIVPLIEFTTTVISILLSGTLLKFAGTLISLHRRLIAILTIVAGSRRNGLAVRALGLFDR